MYSKPCRITEQNQALNFMQMLQGHNVQLQFCRLTTKHMILKIRRLFNNLFYELEAIQSKCKNTANYVSCG